MSQALAVTYDCVRCPTECSPTQVPGTPGADGTPGSNGSNGINAYTILTAGFTMPTIGGTVVAEVEDTSWMVAEQGAVYGQALVISFAGTLLITNIVDATHVEIVNLGYTGNAPGGALIPAGGGVSPSGVEGPIGSLPTGALIDTNNLSDVTDVPTARNNLGLGSAATQSAGAFFAVANNLSEGVGATKRTNLGLGTAAVENAGIASGNIAKNDGALTPGDACFATASGIETKTAANAKVALGIGGQAGNYILAQQVLASGAGESAFNTGSDIPVPITVLVEDESGAVSLNAGLGQLTLPVGTYRVRISVPVAQCDRYQTWLYNFTNNVVELVGSSGFSAATDGTTGISLISGLLVVAGIPKAYGIIGRCTATGTFGVGASFGQDVVISSWELEQET